MAYQFVHIQTYCPKLTRVAGTEDQYNSTEQVFGEAERDPRYSGHVGDARGILEYDRFGAIPVAELRHLHDDRRAAIRETVMKKGGGNYDRSLKSDFPTLYTEIHSHPMTVEQYNDASIEDRAWVEGWIAMAVSDFRERMPHGVQYSVVLHLDEEHVHFHILAVNLNDPKLSANKLHVGKIAAEAWRQDHGPSETLEGPPRPEPLERPRKPKQPKPSKNRATQKKRDAEHAEAIAAWEEACFGVEEADAAAEQAWRAERNAFLRAARNDRKAQVGDVAAYEAALIAFQDRYFEAVGKPSGLLRLGPRAERLPTKQYEARKKQARVLADQAAMLSEEVMELRDQRADLDRRERALTGHAEEMAEKAQDMTARENALAGREAAVGERQVAAQAQEAAIAAREDSVRREEEAVRSQSMALEEREVALNRREGSVAASEAEIEDAVAAIGDLVGQMEQGEISLHDGKLHLGRMPGIIQKIRGVAPADRSPVQKLVARFVDIIRKAVTAIAGGADAKPNAVEDRPGI